MEIQAERRKKTKTATTVMVTIPSSRNDYPRSLFPNCVCVPPFPEIDPMVQIQPEHAFQANVVSASWVHASTEV
jgi:hypothetical protein